MSYLYAARLGPDRFSFFPKVESSGGGSCGKALSLMATRLDLSTPFFQDTKLGKLSLFKEDLVYNGGRLANILEVPCISLESGFGNMGQSLFAAGV